MARLRRHRRLVASGCLGLAVALGLGAVRPAPPTTRAVLVAAHDLVAGQLLVTGDLALRRFPVDLVPAGALGDGDSVAARRVTGAVRAGEPLTDARLVGLSMLRGLSGQVAVPVRVADAEVARLVRPGDRVDLVAGPSDPVGQPLDRATIGRGPQDSGTVGSLLAASALVLAVPGPAGDSSPGVGSTSGGALVVLAVPDETALRVAAATTPITLLLHVTP